MHVHNMTLPLFAQGLGAFPASQRNAAGIAHAIVEAAFQRALDDALPLGRKFWRRAGNGAIGKFEPDGKVYKCFVLYTPDSSLADAIERGEIVVASKWGAEPDWD